MNIIKKVIYVIIQVSVVIYLSLLAQKGLEIIPVPEVFKNMSLIELDDLDRSILQSAVDLKSKFVSSQEAIDTNIIIINVETANPVPRGEIAKAIKFLKDNGAKTIALNVFLDEPRDDIDPQWDNDLAEAIEYKTQNVIGINGFQYFVNDKNEIDTMLSLNPIDKFNKMKAVGFGNLEMTPENEGSIVQQFYPNANFKGKPLKSFPLAVAEHYDSSRAKILSNKFDKEYVNFYKKELFKVWNLSFLTNPIINNAFAPLIKDKLFIIGYINPESDPLKFNMYSTPIGKLEHIFVYAGIISDILTHKFVPESPFIVDMIVGVIFCLMNIMLFSIASKKTSLWEKFTGVTLIPLEIVFIYIVVIFVFVFFNYKLSVVIPSIIIIISIPLNSYTHKKILPLIQKYYSIFKYRNIPYPFLQQYLNIFIHEKRSIRMFTTIFGIQRVLWLLNAFSVIEVIQKTSRKIDNNLFDTLNIKSWDDLYKFVSENKNLPINAIIYSILNEVRENIPELSKLSDEYYRIYTHNNLKRELYSKIEEEKDIEPYKDNFYSYKVTFTNLINAFLKKFDNYKLIFIIKKKNDSYLVKDLMSIKHSVYYFHFSTELTSNSIYLIDESNNALKLEPLACYIFCKYHQEKELFVFSNLQYDEYTSKKRAHYIGNTFTCSPLVPPSKHDFLRN